MNKKGLATGTVITILLAIVIMVIVIAFMSPIFKSGSDTVDANTVNTAKDICTSRLKGFAIDEKYPVTGEDFARTVVKCGTCIGKYQGNEAYYLLDKDQDGIPDYCDKKETDPATDDRGNTYKDQCKGKWISKDQYGMFRCCVDGMDNYCE